MGATSSYMGGGRGYYGYQGSCPSDYVSSSFPDILVEVLLMEDHLEMGAYGGYEPDGEGDFPSGGPAGP